MGVGPNAILNNKASWKETVEIKTKKKEKGQEKKYWRVKHFSMASLKSFSHTSEEEQGNWTRL